ncbi:cupin domain-containing protein [Paraburkholderia unamae]|uniref:cupin domain-containing protein n=1 Tax=Paraburkholderia unamae TaxID=219649 RepID=UPI0020983B0F|nr:cupin domain-containing protein [Paraburkholderia unamae]
MLTHVQLSHIGVARLARALECELDGAGQMLRKEVGANLFLTPPSSQGFQPHYDGHDVLIVQLEGDKTWELFDPVQDIRVGMEGDRVPPDQLSPIRDSFQLRQGDVLYIPRGLPHVARSTIRNSLHLTLSIVPTTWTDYFTENLKCRNDVDTRVSEKSESPILKIDSGRATDLKKRLRRRWLSMLSALPETAPWTDSKTSVPEGVRLAEGVIADVQLRPTGDGIDLRLPGGEIRLGAEASEAVERILDGQFISLDSLSLGGRSDDSKARFLQRLIEIGLASPASE